MPTSLRHPGVVLLLQVLGLHGVGSHARRNPAGCGWTPRGPPPWCAGSSCGGRRWRGRSATSRRPAPSLLGCSISTLVVASSRVVGSTDLARRLASPSTARRISSSMLRLAAWRLRASTLSASTSPTSPHLCRSCTFNAPRKMRSNSSLGLKAHSRSASTRLEGHATPNCIFNVLRHLLSVVLLAVDVLLLELCLCCVVLGVTSAAVRWVEESRPPLPPHCRARRRCSQMLRGAPHKHGLHGMSAPFRPQVRLHRSAPALPSLSLSADLVVLVEPHVHLCSRSACSRSCRVRSGNALRSKSPPHRWRLQVRRPQLARDATGSWPPSARHLSQAVAPNLTSAGHDQVHVCSPAVLRRRKSPGQGMQGSLHFSASPRGSELCCSCP
mmetsp:Transcript_173662/g.551328  ORF Transcript_173662/g.551328 Transcript_173662/m.551328 type:complete len:384 (+) Transcript_173662:358-1509(+)